MKKNIITVKKAITADEFIFFVETVVKSSFTEAGEYNGSFEMISRRHAICKYLLEGIEVDNDNGSKTFNQTMAMDWHRIMNELESTHYWNELCTAIEKQIEYSRRPAQDKFFDTLRESLANISDLSSIKAVAERLAKIDDQTLIDTITKE